jgi:5-deoxy-glucuronate isomerase
VVNLDQDEAGWSWSSLQVVVLAAGASHSFSSAGQEMLVLPLAGSCTVRCRPSSGEEVDQRLAGRADVFAGATDFAYVPAGASVVVESDQGGRFALPGARATGAPMTFRYQEAAASPVELRGAGNCSRRVVNYCMPATFDAERLLACEVVTPGGNWSSYPPHKHDEDAPGETSLEEIYYFEVADGPYGAPGFAFQRIYGTREKPVELLAEVRNGDVVLIPHGYHGPSMAAPGYDLYYLNVMAGPGRREWLATDDPAHAWVRTTWAGQAVDARLLEAPGRKSAEGSMQ